MRVAVRLVRSGCVSVDERRVEVWIFNWDRSASTVMLLVIYLVGKAQTFAVGSIPTSCIEGLDLIVQSGCHLLFTERAVTNATRLRFEDKGTECGRVVRRLLA